MGERLAPGLLSFLLLVAAAIATPVSSIAASADSDEGFLDRVTSGVSGFFSFGEPVPEPLRDALEAYAGGRFFDVLASVEALDPRHLEHGADEASLLRALALRELGWDDLALPLFSSLLEMRPPSPYYPIVLAGLVEIHHAADRPAAVADAFGRYFDRPLRSAGADAERIADLLFEYGTLRSGRARLSPREKRLLSTPEELKVLLEDPRERPTERVLYLSGLALFRLGRYDETVGALRWIDPTSPYYPYALYTMAQSSYALGSQKDALRALSRLVRYPETNAWERGLESRARMLQARMLFGSGDTERGIRLATSIPEDDPYARDARTWVAEVLVEAGEPALALAYARDGQHGTGRFALEARRALVLGHAYRSLGDVRAAAETFRTVSRLALPGPDEAVARLRSLAETDVREEARDRDDARRHLVEGLGRVVRAEPWGPWNLGRPLRAVGTALGARHHADLARGVRSRDRGALSADDLWIEYLRSPQRATVEALLRRRIDLDARGAKPTVDHALAVANAYAAVLDLAVDPRAPEEADRTARRLSSFVAMLRDAGIPPLDIDRGAPLRPQLVAWRRALVAARRPVVSVPPIASAALQEAGDDAARLLERRVEQELRSFIGERMRAREQLELDLQVELAQTLASGTAMPDADL